MNTATSPQYIAKNLLNVGDSKNFVATIIKDESTSKEIKLPRRKLFIKKLSEEIHMDICLLSSRSKAHFYKKDGVMTTVVVFHAIDSYLGTSEYLVLTSPTNSTTADISHVPPALESPPLALHKPAQLRSSNKKRKHEQKKLPSDFSKDLSRQVFVTGFADHGDGDDGDDGDGDGDGSNDIVVDDDEE
ncbi:hypothetical protein BGX28_009591 [Mortierella sp. GBA30]|nr:hypothetical protein BGX28_009591 [Mortierella sp. GBA30]